MDRDEHFMRLALLQAEQAATVGEVPVGAVLVHQDQVIASAHNFPIGSCDPSAHAEMLVLRAAAKKIGNYRLIGTTLYVTLEPCLMCAGALVHSRIERLVYAASDHRQGAIQSQFSLSSSAWLNHRFDVTSGLLQEESVQLLQRFFRERR